MTNEPTSALLPVEQVDKDRAAQHLGYSDWSEFYEASLPILRHGVDLAQAFAAHRLAHTQPPAPEVEWQPIETAPRDGSYILLYGPDGKDYGQYVDIDQGVWSRFMTAEWDNEMADISTPTHWMPLPPPPATESLAPDGGE